MLTVDMTHQPTVATLGRIFPVASVSGPRLMRFGSQMLWRWRVYRLEHVIQVGELLLPFLVTKQEIVGQAVQACRR